MTSKPVSIIVAALLPNYGIGLNGGLPWRLSNELKYFKRVTTGDTPHSNAVVMGRKTWESIPKKFRPLRDRVNVVVSRSRDTRPEGSELVFHSLGDALGALQSMGSVKKIFVIGGQQVYAEMLPMVDHLLITEITSGSEMDIDTYFDREYVQAHFEKASREELEQHIGFHTDLFHTERDLSYEYTLYKRKK